MARYKHIDTSPRFLPVDLARQLLPGTFEHALNHLLDHEIDLSHFDRRFRNAAKSRSGTRTDFERQAAKLEAAAKTMLQRHREEDAKPVEPDLAAKEGKRIERLKRDAAQLRGWLAAHPEERRGVKGAMRKSNRTDNESAKMATGEGVIQGYTGVAAVDGKHQVIVEAQAHGTGSEQELLVPVVVAMKARSSPTTACAGATSGSQRKSSTGKRPIRCTTNRTPRRRPRPIGRLTSPTILPRRLACARRESRCTATAAVSSTGTRW